MPLAGAVVRFELVRGRGDAELARLAELQHGHVHLRQLRAAGIHRNALAHRVRSGRLHPTLPRVYLVGRPHADSLGRMMAAALYYRGDGLVSGNAAACVWGQLDSTRQLRDRDPIRVLLVGRNGMEPEGISLHRARTVARQDVRWRHGIPLTSPARTLLDLAATVDDLELESALLASLRKNLVRRSSLIDVVDRNPRAKGIGVIRQLLASVTSLHDTRSIYERKLLALLRAADLPLPLTNAMVAGKVVDGVWPDLKLIYEFDGWEYHRDKFESDRLRDQGMLAAGHQVLRISGRQIDREPYALIARFASTMAGLKLRSSS